MTMKTKSVTRTRTSGMATMAVGPPGQIRLRRGSAGSDSVRGAPSFRVSLVKIANIDLSRGSLPSRALSIRSRTCC